MAPPVAVTFDFWNTLCARREDDSQSRRVDAWLAVLEGEGLAAERDALHLAFTENWEAFERHWHQNLRYDAQDAVSFVLGRLGLDPPVAVRDQLVTAITDPPELGEPDLTPNIAACLATLRDAGTRIGIICDVGLVPSTTLRRFLEHHGVLAMFDHWSFSDEVGVFKPDPTIFRHALDGLGVTDPTVVAHVGDLRRTDVAGAKAMGITAVRYTGIFDDPGRAEDGEPIEGDHVVADHADLPAVLGFA